MSRVKRSNEQPKSLVVISYWSGVPGSVTSEWLEDKLKIFIDLGYKITLLTCPMSSLPSNESVTVARIPSLSRLDFGQEWNHGFHPGTTDIPMRSKISRGLLKVISASVGRVFDFVFSRLAGSYSDGRWSWFIMAIPVAVWASMTNRGSMLFTTGGPSVSHLVGLVASRLVRRRLFCEAQDPLIGSEMQMSNLAKKILTALEQSLIKNSEKMIFVTQSAAKAARLRTPLYADKVQAIYPGSFDYGVKPSLKQTNRGANNITLTHFGHLYGSRNLDLLFRAIDELIAENAIQPSSIRIRNLGPAYLANREDYLSRCDYEESPLRGRIEGLREAARSDCLLLVQHSDSRSEETIPYKTYDYLNLGLPILGLINNQELEQILSTRGFIGSAISLDKTKKALMEMVRQLGGPQIGDLLGPSPFDFPAQVKKIFEIV